MSSYLAPFVPRKDREGAYWHPPSPWQSTAGFLPSAMDLLSIETPDIVSLPSHTVSFLDWHIALRTIYYLDSVLYIVWYLWSTIFCSLLDKILHISFPFFLVSVLCTSSSIIWLCSSYPEFLHYTVYCEILFRQLEQKYSIIISRHETVACLWYRLVKKA